MRLGERVAVLQRAGDEGREEGYDMALGCDGVYSQVRAQPRNRNPHRNASRSLDLSVASVLVKWAG